MSKFFLITIFFLASCSSNNIRNDINFSDEMSFSEFKIKLMKYSENNSYPNIDN